jgi:hypothetical protein
MGDLNIKEFDSFFNHVDISSKIIEEQIVDFKLTFSSVRNQFVEWKLRLPTFLDSFYRFIYKNKRIPTQEEFWVAYQEDNVTFFTSNNFDNEIMIAIKARVYRTHPSFVRDIHFTCYVRERINGNVVYNRKLDVNHGIDMLIEYKEKLFGVNLYTATKISVGTRGDKQNRHEKHDNVNSIELPIEFKGSNICGDFFLYGEKEYNKLINELDSVVLQDTYELGHQL